MIRRLRKMPTSDQLGLSIIPMSWTVLQPTKVFTFYEASLFLITAYMVYFLIIYVYIYYVYVYIYYSIYGLLLNLLFLIYILVRIFLV